MSTENKAGVHFLVIGLLLVFTVFIAAVWLAFRLGTFQKVHLSMVTANDFTFISKEHIGPYHEIEGSIEEVEKWAKEHNVPCPKTIAEFLDDPDTTEHARLRSQVGCWVGEGQIDVREKGPYVAKTVHPEQAIEATFTGSPSIGPFKVYPKVGKFLANKGLERKTTISYEIYTVTSPTKMTTRYLLPLK